MTVPMGSGTTGTFNYGYDDLGRMASLTNPLGDETDWLYHTNDWLSSQYDYDGSAASGTSILKDSYSYLTDARGLVSRLFDAGPTGGHIAEFGSTSSPTSPMTYDAENWLTTFNGNGSGTSGMAAGYDCITGLRVWRTQGCAATSYVYAGIEPVVELSSTGTLVALNTYGAYSLISRATRTAALSLRTTEL